MMMTTKMMMITATAMTTTAMTILLRWAKKGRDLPELVERSEILAKMTFQRVRRAPVVLRNTPAPARVSKVRHGGHFLCLLPEAQASASAFRVCI